MGIIIDYRPDRRRRADDRGWALHIRLAAPAGERLLLQRTLPILILISSTRAVNVTTTTTNPLLANASYSSGHQGFRVSGSLGFGVWGLLRPLATASYSRELTDAVGTPDPKPEKFSKLVCV